MSAPIAQVQVWRSSSQANEMQTKRNAPPSLKRKAAFVLSCAVAKYAAASVLNVATSLVESVIS